MIENILSKTPPRLLVPIGTGRRYQRALSELEERGYGDAGLALLLQGQDVGAYTNEELAWLRGLPNQLLEVVGGTVTWRGQVLLVPAYLSRETIGGWLWQVG